ncbi:heavy metal translocating P-type ATPase [Aeropyrum camini]|nr:heavy metal translocating P-type ATPase [Aeropyrum camini]
MHGDHGNHGHDHHSRAKSRQDHADHAGEYKRRFIVSSILTVPILILSPSIQRWVLGSELAMPGSLPLLWGLSTAVYVYGGSPFLSGLVRELRRWTPGMMTLIGIAITTAYIYSSAVVFFIEGATFFWELATLIDVMLLGHWIEMKTISRASRALELLAKSLPATAHLVTEEGEIVNVDVSMVKPGDKVLVKPGEKMPVDGVVVEGVTSVDEALVTGESKPVTKRPGDKVIAGAVNLEGSIIVRAEKTGRETYIAQVIELIKSIQESKSRAQDISNRVAKWLTVIALTGGGFTAFTWLYLGQPATFALERAVTVMVIACPHALGLAVPLVIARSTALAAAKGILIRDRIGFEKAREVTAVVFDKTGTLTKGVFEVTDLVALGSMDPEEALAIAASLEGRSEHPIAQSIVRYAKSRGVKLRPVEDFRAMPGKGVVGRVNGIEAMVVSPGYLKEAGLEVSDGRVDTLVRQGKTVVFLLVNRRPAAAIALSDVIREESREAIATLKKMGIKPIMLTGDNRRVAEWVAKELGIDEFYAEVLPHEKVEVVRQVRSKGHIVAMVGDGVNDAPALIEADVGIAIGAGTDIAIESADIVLVKNDPRDVPVAIELSRKTYRKVVQNLAWATGYNAIALPLAAGILYPIGILLPPAAGAFLMSMSTVIVAVNATLLR